MLCLPSLIGEPGRGELPLDDRSAVALIEMILAPDIQERMNGWCRVLANCPSFSLWLCCRTRRWHSAPPNDLTELAQMAASQTVSLLAAAHPTDWPAADDATIKAEKVLRRTSVARAVETAESCRRDGVCSSAEFPQEYLFGLLANGPEWLTLSDVSLDEPAVRDRVPPWLFRLWADRQEPSDHKQPSLSDMATVELPEADALSAREGDATDGSVSTDDGIVARLASKLPWLINHMARLERLEQQFDETLQREKLESLRQFAYGASHEINNPLANISTRAQTLLREETHPERRRKLATINAQAFRAHEMISDMMLFAKPPDIAPEALDVSALVGEVFDELREMAESQGTTLVYHRDDVPLPSVADRVQLAVALKSLCTNALEAIPAGGRIEVTAMHQTNPEDGSEWLVLSVSDTGPGIPPEAHRHLFDPYYSGREAGRGLGLGLAKCWRIVTLHGGHIDVSSRAGQGATFEIHLPQPSHAFQDETPGE